MSVTTPTAFVLDIMNARLTPLRFVVEPGSLEFRYYDRRFITAPGSTEYGPNFNIHGQACGGSLSVTHLIGQPTATGWAGWHDEHAWDVDDTTARIVAAWLTALTLRPR